MLLPAGAAEWGETEGGLAMATLLGHARFIAGALALALMLMLSPPAGAQHVNPTAELVKEEAAARRAQAHYRRMHDPRPEGLHARAAGRP